MTVHEAIKRMRILSRKNIPFSFSFMSYSRAKQTSDGIIEVRNAVLRRRSKVTRYEHSEMIEEYQDLDINEPRKFYHCTLMTFNGQILQLT